MKKLVSLLLCAALVLTLLPVAARADGSIETAVEPETSEEKLAVPEPEEELAVPEPEEELAVPEPEEELAVSEPEEPEEFVVSEPEKHEEDPAVVAGIRSGKRRQRTGRSL